MQASIRVPILALKVQLAYLHMCNICICKHKSWIKWSRIKSELNFSHRFDNEMKKMEEEMNKFR
jgi:hypothetical protein